MKWLTWSMLILGLLSCSKPPSKADFGKSGAATGEGNDPSDSEDSKKDNKELSLSQCTAPSRSLYRLTRTELANNVASVLKLAAAEHSVFLNALPLDPSTTGYENDSKSMQMSSDLITAISISLDRILTAEKVSSVLNCKAATDLNDACIQSALKGLATRAYFASAADDSRVVSYLNSLKTLQTKDIERLRFAIKNIFISPHFIFNVFDADRLKAHLANLLWLGSAEASDSALLAMKNQDFLKKLLNDDKAKNFTDAFMMRRLHLDGIDKNFVGLSNEEIQLRKSMGEETRLFIWDVFKSDQPITTLLTSQTSFIDPRLAQHYGIESMGEGFVKTKLPSKRRGLLTQASMLTTTSKSTESNIIARGLWITEKVFCQHIPAAPAVDPLPEDMVGKMLTPRQKLEAHRAKKECGACHDLFDPAGYALENFGPNGQWREAYTSGLPLDTKAQFNDGSVTNTPEEFFAYVEKNKSRFSECFAGQLLTYILRRELTAADKCALDAVQDGFTQKNWGLETAMLEILRWHEASDGGQP